MKFLKESMIDAGQSIYEKRAGRIFTASSKTFLLLLEMVLRMLLLS
jgi:hypothetical protein